MHLVLIICSKLAACLETKDGKMEVGRCVQSALCVYYSSVSFVQLSVNAKCWLYAHTHAHTHAHTQSPSSTLGTRLPAQDYNKIRRQCLAEGTLFEDPYFPATPESLFFSEKLPFTPEWKRPKVCLYIAY